MSTKKKNENKTEEGSQVVVTGKSGADAGPGAHFQQLALGKFGIHSGDNRKGKIFLAVAVDGDADERKDKENKRKLEVFGSFDSLNGDKGKKHVLDTSGPVKKEDSGRSVLKNDQRDNLTQSGSQKIGCKKPAKTGAEERKPMAKLVNTPNKNGNSDNDVVEADSNISVTDEA